jgi:hypothetical protein
MSTEPSVFATETIVPFAIASAIAGGLVVVWAFFSSSLIGSLLGWFVKMMFKAKGVRVTFSTYLSNTFLPCLALLAFYFLIF